MSGNNQKYTRTVALSMVVANMIGVGVFSSLGYQVVPVEGGGIPDAFSILTIWTLGGIIALCGAFAYAEVATTLKESGGEYLYLSKLYHPSLGFASGWISLVVGFAGAIASTGIIIGEYSAPVFGIDPESGFNVAGEFVPYFKLVSVGTVVLMSAIHILGVKTGGAMQNILTSVKVVLIAVFLVAPFVVGGYEGSGISFAPSDISADTIFSVNFAAALVWVMYAYSGWNAAAYIAGNVENPKKTIPFALVGGTLIVMVIYVLLNAVFMYVSPFGELAGNSDVGNIVATKVFGTDIGLVFSGIFSLALISGLSAMVIAGPRVTEQVGKDYSMFRKLAVKSKGGTPTFAIILQAVIAISLILISSFAQLIQTIGITLSVFALLTVAGLFIVRMRYPKEERPVRAWGYPVTPLIFIVATSWMIWSVAEKDLDQIWYSLLAIAPGVLLYFVVERRNR
jgi:APA family basic amino acid/polyamine antiporter